MTDDTPDSPPRDVQMTGTPGLWDWLGTQGISLGFTTYQTNRLFLVGCHPDGRLAVNERLFDKPMGLFAENDKLYMACRYQIFQFENRLGAGEQHHGADRLFVPSTSWFTGDLNVHDVVMTRDRRLVFINTDFSCLATLKPGFSFEPLWQPSFISKLVAEDRCHLNGLALENGEPAYVTACSSTDEAAGWRDQRSNGGVAIHLPSNGVVASGLSMPHSPRVYRGKLWLLNSGTGELGHVANGRFHPLCFLPGFVRGLVLWRDFAIVGLSKLRSRTFAGLELERRLEAQGQTSRCGLAVVDLTTGALLHSLQIDGVVEELFDVVVLPGVRQPRAVGFQGDDIDRLVTFPGSNGLVITKPTVQRPGIGTTGHSPGLPRGTPETTRLSVKYQRVFHLNPDNLLAYESMTSPSLAARWPTRAQRGELLGVAASINGDLIGLAVAERWTDEHAQPAAELISLKVLPAYPEGPISERLVKQLEALVGQALAGPTPG